MQITFAYEDEAVALEVRRLRLRERLGEPSVLDLELVARGPIRPRAVVGKACVLGVSSDLGAREVHGIVMEATAITSGGSGDERREGRRLRLRVESAVAVLGLRRRRRIFQDKSAPDIIAQVLEEGGAGAAKRELSGSYAPRRYVTQYDETDLAFVRRLCEEEGLYYRFEPGDGVATVVLTDDVALAPKPLDKALPLAEEAGLGAPALRAWHAELTRRRAPGKVLAADYDFKKPALAIAGSADAGHDSEKSAALYVRSARAADPGAAKARARIVLESHRSDALTLGLSTSAFSVAPGHRFELEPEKGHLGATTSERELFVTETDQSWEAGGAYEARLTAIPARLPYRLAQRTPRPRAHGVDSAIVTGPAGQEIYTDADGCVRARFIWDREGPTDQGSSLPLRVLHPNLAGSLLVPRIGWEVWVGFEEGDPDRPFVLGRAFNGKHVPPVPLPANKTMTSFSTSSSPGAGGQSFLRYEDAAGRQGMSWQAASALVRSIAVNETVQTVADEGLSVAGSQIVSIGANDTESVAAVRAETVGSQVLAVSGNHELETPEAQHTKTGAESVSCASLHEQVGSPGGALDALLSEAASAVGGFVPALGTFMSVASTAENVYNAYQKGGLAGALGELGKAAAGSLPVVGDALGVLEAGGHSPFDSSADTAVGPVQKQGQQMSSLVGGVAAAAGGGAHDAGGGHRVHEIGGAALEAIGGACSINTPGMSKWTTLGNSELAIGGAHATSAGKVSWLVGGVSTHTTGAFGVSATTIGRKARVLETTAAGAFVSRASGTYKIKAKGALNLKCGALKIAGKLVLQCGGTMVVVDGSGLTVKNAKVTFDGPVKCASTHREG